MASRSRSYFLTKRHAGHESLAYAEDPLASSVRHGFQIHRHLVDHCGKLRDELVELALADGARSPCTSAFDIPAPIFNIAPLSYLRPAT